MSERGISTPIGLIGVGTMGKEMLKLLLENEFMVWAYDLSPTAKKQIEELGGKSCEKIQDLAQNCEYILMVLPGPKQVESVVDEILEADKKVCSIICDFTTSTPQVTQVMSERCLAQGIYYLDTPILGRPSLAGRWCLPSGGNQEALDEVNSVLKSFAGKIIRVGDSGAGHTLKLLNQMMFTVTNAMVAEMMGVAKESGISLQVIYDVISESGAATVSGLFKEVGRKIAAEDYDPLFTVDLLIKDAGLSLEMARSWGKEPELAALSQAYNMKAKEEGLGGEDTSALVKLHR